MLVSTDNMIDAPPTKLKDNGMSKKKKTRLAWVFERFARAVLRAQSGAYALGHPQITVMETQECLSCTRRMKTSITVGAADANVACRVGFRVSWCKVFLT